MSNTAMIPMAQPNVLQANALSCCRHAPRRRKRVLGEDRQQKRYNFDIMKRR
jgi:hypothetical protein